jgi:hypothetical protein
MILQFIHDHWLLVSLPVLFFGGTFVGDWLRRSQCRHDRGHNFSRESGVYCRDCGRLLNFDGSERDVS